VNRSRHLITDLLIHRRLIYKEHTSTHAEGAVPRVWGLARAGLRVAWSPAISHIRDRGRFHSHLFFHTANHICTHAHLSRANPFEIVARAAQAHVFIEVFEDGYQVNRSCQLITDLLLHTFSFTRPVTYVRIHTSLRGPSARHRPTYSSRASRTLTRCVSSIHRSTLAHLFIHTSIYICTHAD